MILVAIKMEVSLSNIQRVILECSRFDLCQVAIETQGRADVEAPFYWLDFARLDEVRSYLIVGFDSPSYKRTAFISGVGGRLMSG